MSGATVLWVCGATIYVGSFVRVDRHLHAGSYLLQAVALLFFLYGVRLSTDRLIEREVREMREKRGGT